MKFTLLKHKIRKGVDVVELRDSSGRVLASITPGEGETPRLEIHSNFIDKVGFVGGTAAGVIIKFVNPEKAAPEPKV